MIKLKTRRYIAEIIDKKFDSKMVFLTGLCQCGKTTLLKGLYLDLPLPQKLYLNWDANEDRQTILRGGLPNKLGLIILDEIHKYARWRNWVKGLFDKRKDECRILVTGSAPAGARGFARA